MKTHTPRSWSYRQGFKKGLDMTTNNHVQHGYFADDENKMLLYGFQKQIDEGRDKSGQQLTQNQIEWRKGVVDAIRSRYGSSLDVKRESPFEKREREHYYGEKKPYDGTNWYD